MSCMVIIGLALTLSTAATTTTEADSLDLDASTTAPDPSHGAPSPHDPMAAVAPAPPTSIRWGRMGVYLAGSGLGLLASGGILAGLAAIEAGKVERDADGYLQGMPAARRARTLGWAANWLWIGGGLLATSGITLVILHRDDIFIALNPSPGITFAHTF